MPQLIDPATGTLRDISDKDAAGALAAGWKPEETSDIDRLSTGIANEANYGGASGKVQAALAGIARGATVGASDVLGRAIGGEDTARTLEGLQAQNPITSGVGEFAGVLLPSIVSGGTLAPAGMVSALGRKVTAGAIREGAGLAGRVAGHAVGAAAEGAIFGGGQYLSQVALEDKPLSAEGFVGGMGKGALFAAPVGGAFALGGEALLRARSLFPRSQITAEAGIAAKTEASSALQQSITDGDAMAEVARRKIAMAEAQAGQAGAKTQVTRMVFGGGDPAELATQVEVTANKAQLTEALQKLEESQVALKDWIAAGGDDELADQIAGISQAGQQVPVGEFGAPGARGIKSQGEISRAAAEAGGPEAASIAPTEPSPSTSVIRKGRGAGPPSVDDIGAADPNATTAFDLADSGLQFDANKRSYFDPSGRAMEPTPVGEMRLGLSPRLTPEDITGIHLPGDPGGINAEDGKALYEYQGGRVHSIQEFARSGKVGEGSSFADAEEAHGVLSRLDRAIERAVPLGEDTTLYRGIGSGSRGLERGITGELKPGSIIHDPGYSSASSSRESANLYTNKPGSTMLEIAAPRGTRAARIPDEGLGENELLLPRNSRFRVEDVLNENIGGRDVRVVRVTLLGAEGGVSAPASDTLTGLLRGTQDKLSGGANLNDIGAPSRAQYAADKAVKTEEAAKHFRGKANEANFAKSEMGAAEREANSKATDFAVSGAPSAEEMDRFFEEIRRPKTRDTYVAQNIGRAMREEGSHAAALAKVEREWAERTAAEVFAERAATLEYEGGYSRVDAERIARDEIGGVSRGSGSDTPRPNMKRVEAARKASAASVERLREIHSAVSSNLPQELQAAWGSEGYKFLRQEAPRIRGMKDRINASSKISEAFTEQYGAASETSRGYEGDRFHRRAEIDAKHAESWANEQERKHYAAVMDEHQPMELGSNRDLTSGRSVQPEAPPETPEDAQISRLMGGKHPALPEGHSELGKMFGIDLAPAAESGVGNIEDLKSLLSQWSDQSAGTAVDKAIRERMGVVADDAAIERLLQKHAGKNVNIGPQLERAAKVIGDHEAASADVADLLGPDAPKTAVDRAQALQAARRAQAEAHGASAAKAAQGISDRAVPALADKTAVSDDIARALQKHESAVEGAKDRALVSMQRAESKAAAKAAKQVAPAASRGAGIGSKLADVGTAFEVMKALGVHVPALSAIPVIGPVLGLFFKARAVLGILGRKGGSIGRDVDGVIAAKAAATRERIAVATQAILAGAGKGALKLSDISAGPAVTLGYKLFPGPNVTSSKDPHKLYDARMDEIARALQPGAIDHAIADRYQTSDPDLHDAIVQQTQRGIAFLDSKAPKPSILQAVLPGDGVWRPSKAQLDEFGKYVHAVGDPASVLEDLAKGHVTLEGAETLRVVYPELFAVGQQLLLQAAPEMRRTLPYPTRVAISILYRIPVDGSMAPGHLQYLQQGQQPVTPGGGQPPGPGPGGQPGQPGLTGQIKLGQSTMTSLDRRAGS